MGSQAKIVNFAEITANFELTPQQALEYFLGKGVKPTFNWADMMGAEHDTAFTVAKMMDTDLLATVKAKLDKALESGMTLQQFQKELIPTLQKAGWWGKKDIIDPLTGYVTKAQLGSASRLETIFKSNMASAYQVGTWEGIQDNKQLYPFLMYDAVDDARTRPDHAARDGEIHAVDSEFWATHYPPNGYNCRCGVIPMDEEEAIESGLYNPTKPIQTEKWTNPRNGKVYDVPTDVDPGWDHNPGMARKKSIEATAAEKAKTLGAAEQAAIKKAQATQQTAKVAYEKTIQESLLEAQDALEAAQAKYPTLQAQGKIAKALSANTPYLASEIKKLQGVVSDPIELIAKAEAKALKSEQNSMVQTWKQAKKKGKQPSDKADAYVKTLPDEVQASLNAEIDQFTGATAAKLELEKIAIGEASKQAGHKKKLFDKYSKDGTASQYATDPKGLLAKIEKESQAIQDKAEKSAVLSGYKKSILAGKVPSPKQQKVFGALDDLEQQKVLDDIEAKKGFAPSPVTPPKAASDAKVTKQSAEPDQVDGANLTQIGPQAGSNKGGLYQDTSTGIKYYLKQPTDFDVAYNEMLANKLYQRAGVDVPDVQIVTVNGERFLASRIIPNLEKSKKSLESGKPKGIGDDFVFDAWLANWDVVGLEYDNMLVKGGKVFRIDNGGALIYRAQGGKKTNFGDEVLELQSLRDASINPQAARVFKNVTDEQIAEGANRLAKITDKEIRDLVNSWGPGTSAEKAKLAKTLIARRNFIVKKYAKLSNPKLEAYKAQLALEQTEVLSNKISDLDNRIKEAVIGIAKQRDTGNPIRDKDRFRVEAVVEAYEDMLSQYGPTMNSAQHQAFIAHYKTWVDDLKTVANAQTVGQPARVIWADQFKGMKATQGFTPKIDPKKLTDVELPDDSVKIYTVGQIKKEASGLDWSANYSGTPPSNLADLNKAELGILKTYTGGDYRRMNRSLRENLGQGPFGILAKMMNAALARCTKYKGITSRGLNIQGDDYNSFMEKIKTAFETGSPWRDFGMMSTSKGTTPAFGGNIILILEGKSGVDIAKISRYGAEKEVIFPSGVQWDVNKYEEKYGKTYIYLEEV